MPKLSKEIAKAVDSAESTGNGFAPLENGVYRVRLGEVKATTARSSGAPMWSWMFETVEAPKGRRLWTNTVLGDTSFWKIAEIFDAFGVSTDTDTDELIGCTVEVDVTQRVIEAGDKKGQMSNNIASVRRDVSEDAITAENATWSGTLAGAKADLASEPPAGRKRVVASGSPADY
jgi:Protein of unknown function (DUF669)